MEEYNKVRQPHWGVKVRRFMQLQELATDEWKSI